MEVRQHAEDRLNESVQLKKNRTFFFNNLVFGGSTGIAILRLSTMLSVFWDKANNKLCWSFLRTKLYGVEERKYICMVNMVK